MGVDTSPTPNKVLDGVHGMRLLPHSPFKAENIHQHAGYDTSSDGTCQSLVIQ